MTPGERNEFLYKHRELLPFERRELMLEHLEKAKALIDQELILDKLYDQMDYKTMGNLNRTLYINALQNIDNAFAQVKKLWDYPKNNLDKKSCYNKKKNNMRSLLISELETQNITRKDMRDITDKKKPTSCTNMK